MENHIGIRIKNRRIELGMSQDELAEKMGYKSRSTISKIESGENDVTQTTIIKFSQALNTTIGYLIENAAYDAIEEDPSGFGKKIGKAIKSADTLELLSLYNSLNDNGKKEAMQFLRYLVENNR